ncbi:hypothetical protein UA08_06688 [Talaromyces atroroseus]|uniref:Transmembrane protein 184-like protein n=1 Tax=Talaromyces atroroseus TaxID=1441469 RepID=A0A225AAK5_TALAT|nr:hypothetical protein UA08_06688 [Talaromyces atroroseus]OKL58001.1 hypothetical protein UA08_06688 [Talaromyces atroroseus]
MEWTVASSPAGTGSRLTRVLIIIAGVASLVATLLSIVKNYRKPLLQRYVVRILLMIPIYAASSWTSIISLKAAMFLDPVRDIYEAFTIYTFFQLLINFVGGERSLIIMTHGRPPVQHMWPMNTFLAKVDISDPHTFLAIKRGILQYAWLKPILALASIIMKATDTYQEGYIGASSGYMWTGIIYNVSVSVSLYSLALFWICMHNDLKPFRPMPKFLCVKLIIFASYWQGFFLSILQWLGAIPNGVAGYTPDNLAAAIQDTLICIEMPAFAIAHWYAFSWHDYADNRVSSARLPVKHALRDSFGVRDLIEDTKQTFQGNDYEYRLFDSGDNIIAHEESSSRVKRVMEGMRYERGGKGKYWIPKPGEANSRTPLLAGNVAEGQRSPLHGSKRASIIEQYRAYAELEETTLDEDDERLFANARALEFGDWNYPVITANIIPRDQALPRTISYQNPTSDHGNVVRKARKHRNSHVSNTNHASQVKGPRSRRTPRQDEFRRQSSTSAASVSRRSQLVDLVVEDREAEQQYQRRAQRETGSAWPERDALHLQRPAGTPVAVVQPHGTDGMVSPSLPAEFTVGEDDRDNDDDDANTGGSRPLNANYSDFGEEHNVWGS